MSTRVKTEVASGAVSRGEVTPQRAKQIEKLASEAIKRLSDQKAGGKVEADSFDLAGKSAPNPELSPAESQLFKKVFAELMTAGAGAFSAAAQVLTAGSVHVPPMKPGHQTWFENLAGHRHPDPIVKEELQAAGFELVKKPVEGEVTASVGGILNFLGGRAELTRQWYYWSVAIAPPLSAKEARPFNDVWGKDVRVDGYAGGKDVNGPVHGFHVDSAEGLAALSEYLRSIRAGQSPT